MKKKTQRQLNAYHRIQFLLENPSQINIEETKKHRNGLSISLSDVQSRLEKESDILKSKLEDAGVQL